MTTCCVEWKMAKSTGGRCGLQTCAILHWQAQLKTAMDGVGEMLRVWQMSYKCQWFYSSDDQWCQCDELQYLYDCLSVDTLTWRVKTTRSTKVSSTWWTTMLNISAMTWLSVQRFVHFLNFSPLLIVCTCVPYYCSNIVQLKMINLLTLLVFIHDLFCLHFIFADNFILPFFFIVFIFLCLYLIVLCKHFDNIHFISRWLLRRLHDIIRCIVYASTV